MACSSPEPESFTNPLKISLSLLIKAAQKKNKWLWAKICRKDLNSRTESTTLILVDKSIIKTCKIHMWIYACIVQQMCDFRVEFCGQLSRLDIRQSRLVCMTFAEPHLPEQTLETAIKLTAPIIPTTKLTRLKNSSRTLLGTTTAYSVNPLPLWLVKPIWGELDWVWRGHGGDGRGLTTDTLFNGGSTGAGLGGSEASWPISLWAELFSPCISTDCLRSAPSLLYSQPTTASRARRSASPDQNHTHYTPLIWEFPSRPSCRNDFRVFATPRCQSESYLSWRMEKPYPDSNRILKNTTQQRGAPDMNRTCSCIEYLGHLVNVNIKTSNSDAASWCGRKAETKQAKHRGGGGMRIHGVLHTACVPWTSSFI